MGRGEVNGGREKGLQGLGCICGYGLQDIWLILLASTNVLLSQTLPPRFSPPVPLFPFEVLVAKGDAAVRALCMQWHEQRPYLEPKLPSCWIHTSKGLRLDRGHETLCGMRYPSCSQSAGTASCSKADQVERQVCGRGNDERQLK